jgi:antitoxin ParD1/3/4
MPPTRAGRRPAYRAIGQARSDSGGWLQSVLWRLLPRPLSIGEDRTDIRPTPTRNISLTPEQNAFIDEMLEVGEYRDASEAVRDAIRALQRRRAEEALKLENLRVAIQRGVAALNRGAFTEVED